MITTSMGKFMNTPLAAPRWRPRIIPWLAVAILALVLTGCSIFTVAYNRVPTLAYWRLDSALSLTAQQQPWVREGLTALHEWHRRDQLPRYADTLQAWQALAQADLTAAQVCLQFETLQSVVGELFEQSLPLLARLAASLSDEQVLKLRAYQSEQNEEFERDFVSGTTAVTPERQKRSLRRTEMLYGSLQPSQREWLAQSLVSGGFDPVRTLKERRRRQADVITAIGQIRSGAQAEPVLRAVWARIQRSPDTAYLAYSRQWRQQACVQFAELHNQMTPEQRAYAVGKLGGFERDFVTLAMR
jgi:hypothetical protein